MLIAVAQPCGWASPMWRPWPESQAGRGKISSLKGYPGACRQGILGLGAQLDTRMGSPPQGNTHTNPKVSTDRALRRHSSRVLCGRGQRPAILRFGRQ